VADADADAKAGSTDGAGTTASPGSGDGGEDGTTAAPVPEAVPDIPAEQATPAPAGGATDTSGPQVAPAVADALDEIVTPLGDERAAS
jgi:hypothetical protein